MKLKKFLGISYILIATLLLSGCPQSDEKSVAEFSSDGESYGIPVNYGTSYKENLVLDTDGGNLVSYDSLKKYFVPDYSVENPDENADNLSGTDSSAAKKSKPSESVIPGLRDLSKYKTKYNPVREKIPDPPKEEISPEYKSTSAKTETSKETPVEFTIEDWGPTTIQAENENPTFYVIFSKPVKALTALGEPVKQSDVMTITPAIDGVFRWYGSQHLSFEASEPADPSVEYTITINKNLKSLSGDKLKGKTTFKTSAAPLRVNSVYGGYIKENDCAYDNTTGALPPYENKFYIRLNYMITTNTFYDKIDVKVGNRSVKYSVTPDYTGYFPWGYNFRCDKDKKKTNSFAVTIRENVPHDKVVQASVKDGYSYESYNTLRPFDVSYVNNYCSYTDGNKENPLYFGFTQKPDLDSLLKNIRVGNFKITKDNIEISGRNVILFNLPLESDKSYELTISNGVKDVYGQSLANKNQTLTYTFKTRGIQGYVKYIDYGARIMEAQFPHKLIFEHQNIMDDSYYVISNISNPLSYEYSYRKNNPAPEYIRNNIDPGQKNRRHFEEIDLNPYLTNGYGWVKFEAHTNIKSWYYWSGEEYINDNSNIMTIQVTDLAATARVGINKAVVMVRSLKTGKPVSKAKVTLCFGTDEYSSAYSDSNGLAVINFNENDINEIEYQYKRGYKSMSLLVKKGDDKMMFYPSTHSNWREGVYTGTLAYARSAHQRTFMFVDRGLYKAGETVTFRGIDRDQLLGSLKAVKTNYTIRVKGAWWDSDDIISSIKGTTSESGGFYGSFKLPDELKPGTYTIRYTRNGSNDYESISFTVANFERVKFEASVKIPQGPYYGGDKLTAELSASYLAGGALSNASYSATWYQQPGSFYTSNPKARGYMFSSYDWDSSRNYWSDEYSSLSQDGTATLNCNTSSIGNGRPVQYKVEAYVTDVSNQRIAASTSVTVHPASFYFGVKRPRNVRGYPKKGTKLEFPYILVDVNGNLLSETDVKDRVNKLSYSLSREEWTLVHEQSVDDTVYTRYERTTVHEDDKSIKANPEGILEITPKECGWYTLSISGEDSRGRSVYTSYEFYVSGGRSFWFDSYNSQSLKLTPDQSEYNPGDKAQILIESPLPAGDYLITVEREGIFTEEVRHFDSPANVIEIPISGTYVPVVYVTVSSYSERQGPPKHEYGEVDLDKPKGYFGVTPVFVNPYVRAFSIKIESDKTAYKPGEMANLTLTATKGGKPISGAELTVMAVDRGVLDLINYHVPNPIDFFYSKSNFPLYTRGGDSREMIMDPVTYSIKHLNGGDADETKEEERKDFRPTAVFEPALITDSSGKVKCSFKMPDSLTTFRITAFGVKNDYFALKEAEVKVQNPVNVQQVQPRRLRERDTAECGVLITNLQNKGMDVTIEASIRIPTGNTKQDELEGRATVPGSAFIDGNTKHKVYVAPGESSVVYFDIAAEKAGTVEIVYSVNCEVLKEKLVSPIKIEKTYVYETTTLFGQTDNTNKKDIRTEQLFIPDWAKDGRGDFTFTLDATRLGVLGGSVNYLFAYPYGCMEQQSSKVLPLVLFDEYIDVFEMRSEVSDVKKCVTSFTQKWVKSQQSDGGFPYWPNGTKSDLFVSMRIAQIYGAAIKRGYTAKELGYNINNLTSYIAKEIKSSKYSDYYAAYACYTLKLNGSSALDSKLDELYQKRDKLDLDTEALVALAYLEGKNADKKRAEALAKDIRTYLQPVERSVSISQKNTNHYWYWYNTQTDETALILQLFVSLNPKDKMVDRLLISLLDSQKHGYWNSTTTTARVLDSIYTYIKMRDLDNTNYTGSVSVAGKTIMSEKFSGPNAKPKTLKLPFEDKYISSLEKNKAIPVQFQKDGTGYLFYTMEMKYALPDEMQNFRDEGIEVKYTITDYESGKVINIDSDTDSSLFLETGKVYRATVTVSSTRNRSYVALRCPIPSGAEILDSTFVTSGSQAEVNSYEGWWSNRSIMDNEVQYFWDSFRTGTKSVSFTFRTSRRGVYPTPPVQAECMYEPEVFGRSNGYLIQIK